MATLRRPMPLHRNRAADRSMAERQRRFYVHFGIYLVINVALAILNIQKNSDHLWFYWVAAGWGIGMAFHAARAFCLIGCDEDEVRKPTKKPETVDSMAGDEGI